MSVMLSKANFVLVSEASSSLTHCSRDLPRTEVWYWIVLSRKVNFCCFSFILKKIKKKKKIQASRALRRNIRQVLEN